MGITRVTIRVIGVITYLLSPPDPPRSQLQTTPHLSDGVSQVQEARERYPESAHAAFDVFLESLEAALAGKKDCKLQFSASWSELYP